MKDATPFRRDDAPGLRDVNEYRMFPELLIAHQGHSELITGVHGHVSHGLHGFYHHKTRFLSRFRLTIDGRDPAFVAATPVAHHSMIAYYLAEAPPSPTGRGAGEVREKGLEVQVNRFVGDALHQDVRVTNRTLDPVTFTLAFEAEVDFDDICAPPNRPQVRDEAPIARRVAEDPAGGLTLRYDLGHETLSHGTILAFPRAGEVAPTEAEGRIQYVLTLQPQQAVHLCLGVRPVFLGEVVEDAHPCDAFTGSSTDLDRRRQRWAHGNARLHAKAGHVQDAWDRAVSDLGALALHEGTGEAALVPAAGIPIYQALFGRDTLTAAWQSALLSPAMLRGVIEAIGSRLGTRYDDRFDEQPGRVIHQAQRSPSALAGHTPFSGYYGDYAGPGLFLLAVARHYAITGDAAFFRAQRERVERVLGWMDRDGDRDGDGFYEYDTRLAEGGTKNQGWKDSPEAFVYRDGTYAPNPLAAAEIQGYYYDAKREIGQIYRALGDEVRGRALLHEAEALKRRFNQAFWLPEERFLALALDPDKRPLASIASNAGHCLMAGIVDDDKARDVADRLLAPDMFSGWGIRTLSAGHPAYNPFLYHLGTVWPSENATIAWGLKRYGFTAHLETLAKGFFDATLLFDRHRLPEAIGGHARDRLHPHPGIYPRACAPQAWSASAVVLMIQALLGLRQDAARHAVVVDPCLPAWLPELTLEGVQVGHGRLDLRFHRNAAGGTDVDVLAAHGGARLLHEPMDRDSTRADDRASA
jgi:glycogen debranching enzyme